MPRKPRTISSTGIYHIILRSINGRIIFEEPSDYQKYLYILSDSKSKYEIDILAYCLMDNHIHLLLRASAEHLSSYFQSTGTRFVRWYNGKYVRYGHLFQERFHSVAVETVAQYLATLAYIHNNPVNANACRFASEYRWSSFNAFYGEKNPLINPQYSYHVAGSKDLLLQYFSFNSDSGTKLPIPELHQPVRHYLSDEQALQLFRSLTQLASTSDAEKLTKAERNRCIQVLLAAHLTQRQIARFMSVSVSTIKRIASKMPQGTSRE